MQRPITLPSNMSKGGEQGRGTVALVVEGQGACLALFHRQARLGPIERLDLALFVHRQHDRMGRRIDVQTDDVLELGGERGVLRQATIRFIECPEGLDEQARRVVEEIIPAALAESRADISATSPSSIERQT
jgi:hypothetical protein